MLISTIKSILYATFKTYDIDFYPILNNELYSISVYSKEKGKVEKIIKSKENVTCNPNALFEVKNSTCNLTSINIFERFIGKYNFTINIQGSKDHYNSKIDIANNQKLVYKTFLGGKNKPNKTAESLVNYVMKNAYIFQYKHKLLKKLDKINFQLYFHLNLKKLLPFLLNIHQSLVSNFLIQNVKILSEYKLSFDIN